MIEEFADRGQAGAHLLSPGLTFGVLGAYAMVALAAGAWTLTRRDP